MRKSKISDLAVVAILVFNLAYKIYFVRTFNGKMFTGTRSGWKKVLYTIMFIIPKEHNHS